LTHVSSTDIWRYDGRTQSTSKSFLYLTQLQILAAQTETKYPKNTAVFTPEKKYYRTITIKSEMRQHVSAIYC